MIVSWDSKKNAINKRKHGIDFDYAKLVFADPHRVELYDVEHSESEDRYIVIGMIANLVVVVYTMRKDTYRIISARKATKAERNYYDKICNS
ncbi:MAG: BrnT family toxin [Lachnospiraceae bacterium]|nr:BrnT family toxin [Lachnospiraceae bacterium]